MLFLSKKYHSKTLRTLEKLLEESKHESYWSNVTEIWFKINWG
jgi:hypothetical protein